MAICETGEFAGGRGSAATPRHPEEPHGSKDEASDGSYPYFIAMSAKEGNSQNGQSD
jgi:hypothetical protein